MRRRILALLLTAALLPLCAAAASGERALRLATTTSTENSGLLRAILPRFEAATGLRVQVISVGTGKAMRLGGMVQERSIRRDTDGVTVRFVVTDGDAQTPVVFRGILPDLFTEGQ